MYINENGQTMCTECHVIELHEYLKITLKGRRNPGSPMKSKTRRERVKVCLFLLELHDEV